MAERLRELKQAESSVLAFPRQGRRRRRENDALLQSSFPRRRTGTGRLEDVNGDRNEEGEGQNATDRRRTRGLRRSPSGRSHTAHRDAHSDFLSEGDTLEALFLALCIAKVRNNRQNCDKNSEEGQKQ